MQIGVAGMANVALSDVLRAKEASARLGQDKKDTSVILIWLDGGPSPLDLWDMKPDAPPGYHGICSRPMRTNVPGIHITDMFPRQAKVADKYSIIRSVQHNTNSHGGAAHVTLTGRYQGPYPSVASVASKVCGARKKGVPPYVGIPISRTIGKIPGSLGAGYLGMQYNPFDISGNFNGDRVEVENFSLPAGLTVDRLEDRKNLQKHLDQVCRTMDSSGTFEAMDEFQIQAFDLVTSPAARKAFDLGSEDPDLRARYGRNGWGQSCLLARRMVEAGSVFATVNFPNWDQHWNLEGEYRRRLPMMDAAVATLFEDLAARDLLSKVLVVVAGEMGRTPRMNNGHGKGTPGRDHWSNAMSLLMGGGGVQGGQIVGVTDSRGETPIDRPLTPGDIHATIYHVLGVDPRISFLDKSGRPVPIVEHGHVIDELV